MTNREKHAFIRSLVKGVKDDVLSRVSDMPEDWDGHELRQLLADEFSREVFKDVMRGKRLREYRSSRATLGRL